jgi:hypothetical protein
VETRRRNWRDPALPTEVRSRICTRRRPRRLVGSHRPRVSARDYEEGYIWTSPCCWSRITARSRDCSLSTSRVKTTPRLSRSVRSWKCTTVEEEVVYPRLAEIDSQLEQHAEDEHAKAKELISQIRSGSGDIAGVVSQLQSAVQEHVQEEETKAFPALREQLGGELEDLGKQLAQRKQELTSRR